VVDVAPGVTLPPCTWPAPDRRPCGFPSLYGFRLTGWPPARKAAICALHARMLRGGHWDTEKVWLAARLPPVQNRRRGPVRSVHPGSARADRRNHP